MNSLCPVLEKVVVANGNDRRRGARRPGLCGPPLRKSLSVRRSVFVFLLIVAPFLLTQDATAQPATKKVLILSGTDPNHPGFSTLTQRVRSVLRDTSVTRIEFLYELQEGLIQPPDSLGADEEMASYFRQKYEGKQVDLILALAAPRLKVLLKGDPELFADIPKVFYDFEDEREPTYLDAGAHVTGVWGRLEYSQTLELALALHPEARRVVVVAGSTAQEKLLIEKARAEFRKYEGRAEFTYLADLTFDELKNRLAALPKNCIVYYLTFYRDKAGNRYPGPEALSKVAPTSGAPIYGNSDSYMGSGIVGGSLLDFTEIGKRIGDVGLRILNGEKPEDIPSQTVPNVTAFDWRELQRWGISERTLPPGSDVRFRVPTFWGLYKWRIVGVVAICVLEALLITWLLIIRRRRRMAERERERFALLAGAEHLRMEETVSNVPGIVWEVTIGPGTNSRRVTFISDYIEKMLGYTPEEWRSLPPEFRLGIVYEDDRERAMRAGEEAISSGKENSVRFRCHAKDGRPVWVESHLSPIVDEGGKTVGLRGVSLDITDAKLTEDAKRQGDERNRATLQAIPDLMFLQTRDGVFLDYHATDPKELLILPEEFLGKNMREVLPPELAKSFSERFPLAQETGAPQLFEYELTVGGEVRRYEARFVSCGENILSVVRDITERVKNEEAIRESEKRFRATFEQAAVGVAHAALDGSWLRVNQKLCDIVGYTREELLSRRFQDITHPEDLDAQLELAGRLLAGETETYSMEKRYVRKDGSPVWVNLTSSLARDEVTAVPLYFISIAEDITERRRAEEALRESEEKYRALFETMDEGFTVFDLIYDDEGRPVDQVFRVTNPAFERHTGWSNVVGARTSDFVPEPEAVWLEKFAQVVATGEPIRFTDRAATLNRWYEVYAFRVGEAGSRTVAMIFSDVSERVRVVEALRRSESVLAQAGQMASLGAWEVDLSYSDDLDENPLVWSNQVYRIFGYDPGSVEVSSELFFRHVHPDDRQRIDEGIRAALDERRPYNLEHRIIRADGAERVVQEHAVFDVDEAGQPRRIIGAVQDITERKAAEQSLRRSESVLAQAGQMASLGAWEVDLSNAEDINRNSVIWSDEVYRIFGYDPGSVGVSTDLFYGHVHPDDRQRVEGAYRAAVYEEKPYNLEHRIIRADGAERVVQAHAVLDVDKAGQPRRIMGAVQDITERKAADEALRQSEGRLRRAQQAARVGTWEWDVRTGVAVWSELIWELVGIEPDDGAVTVERFIEFIHPDDRARALRKVDEVITAGEEYYDEFRFVRRGGEVIWVSSSGRLIRSSSGQPERFIGVNIDITERKLVEEALRQSEERFRNMADTAPVLIWMASTDKLCYYFNKQWLDFTGRSPEQEYGYGWAEGVHPDDYARCLEAYTAGCDRREPFKLEYRLRRADGEYRWVLDTGTPRLSSGGEFLGYIGSCVDINDRKVWEEAMHRVVEEVNRLKNQLQEENIYLQEEIKLEYNFSEIVGRSDAVRYVLHKIKQVAPTDSTVLITGETGTGKELVARAIHSESLRRDRPLVKVNCAALSASLIESELFGHEKGAFTGATGRKIGRFELADGATIFLDEIGELPTELQVKLLRVIQEGEFERLGGNRTLKVNVRIIAATNRNLWKEVQMGTFREDLWYRLNVFPITMPPLRQHREDIPLLVEHFVNSFSKKMGKKITSVTPSTLNSLRNYLWPGNVRELANVIERAVITNGGPVLQISNFAEALRTETPSVPNKTLEEMEREYIIAILDATGWRIEGPHGAARILGLHPSTLRTRMVRLKVQKPQFSPA